MKIQKPTAHKINQWHPSFKDSDKKESFWNKPFEIPYFPVSNPVPHINIDDSKWEIGKQTTHFVEIKAKRHNSILGKLLGGMATNSRKGYIIDLLQKMKDQGFHLVYSKYDWDGHLVFEMGKELS